MQKPPSTHDLLRDRLHQRAGLSLPPPAPFAQATFDSLYQTEWSPEFERLMHNRMVMGAFRYGLLAKKKTQKRKWDLLSPIHKKIELYQQTGNTEYLVDIANYCLLAFECDDHPRKHFQALDDHHDHCKLKA
jgi:hypothetical protein